MSTPSTPNGKNGHTRPSSDEYHVAHGLRLELADQIVRDLANGKHVTEKQWNDWKRQDNICAHFLKGVEKQWEVDSDE